MSFSRRPAGEESKSSRIRKTLEITPTGRDLGARPRNMAENLRVRFASTLCGDFTTGCKKACRLASPGALAEQNGRAQTYGESTLTQLCRSGTSGKSKSLLAGIKDAFDSERVARRRWPYNRAPTCLSGSAAPALTVAGATANRRRDLRTPRCWLHFPLRLL